MGTKIFVSSVSKNLEEVRRQVVSSIEQIGHEPIYFESETFAKSSHRLMVQTCLEKVEESQIFLLMVGKEVGSLEQNDGRSVTHLELMQAVSSNKTIIVFVENNLKAVYFDDYLRILSKAKNSDEMQGASTSELKEYVYNAMGDREISKEVFDVLSDAHSYVPWLYSFNSALDVIAALKQELSHMLSSYTNLKNQKQIQSLDKIIENSHRINQYDRFLTDIFPFLKKYNGSKLNEVLRIAQNRLKGGIIFKENGYWINKPICGISTCIGISVYQYSPNSEVMKQVATSGIAGGKEEYRLDDELSYVSLVYSEYLKNPVKTGEVFLRAEELYHCQIIGDYVLTLHYSIETFSVLEEDIREYGQEIFSGIMELQANSEILSILSFFLEGREGNEEEK